MGTSDSWSLILQWLLLMLALTQTECLPSTHAPSPTPSIASSFSHHTPHFDIIISWKEVSSFIEGIYKENILSIIFFEKTTDQSNLLNPNLYQLKHFTALLCF